MLVCILLIDSCVEHVVTHHHSSHLALTMTFATALGAAGWLGAPVRAAEETTLIQRVVAQTTQTRVALRATRELRAGTVSGKHQGWMTVETTLSPSGAFAWNVLEEGGSERTREKVLYALLKGEADACRSGERDGAALTPANYEFTLLPSSKAGQMQIQLKPRRLDPKLIDGVLTVNSDGYPVRLEGKLAKSPSFWVKSISIVKHYSRFAGISLPTSIESLADLKMFGRSTFTMRYRYSEVNGKSVSHAVASAPFVGPSVEILAIHATSSSGSE
jgi:hypothetical protein